MLCVHHFAKCDVLMQLRVVFEWNWVLYPFPCLTHLNDHRYLQWYILESCALIPSVFGTS